jgi:hypothetical protein
VRSVGRPRSKRKESKIDQVVRKMRAKKQQAGTSTKNVPSQKGRKVPKYTVIFFISIFLLYNLLKCKH